MSKNKVYERFKIKVLQIEGVTEYFEIIKLVKSVNLKIKISANSA
jgi:enolase